MTPAERLERSQRAESLLENKLLNEVFAAMHSRFLEQLVAAPLGDLTAVHAHARMKSLEDVKSELQSILKDADFISSGHRKSNR